MPRIRSVHPGLFTDEAFMGLSDAAQIFFVGILTECDDQGVFEWKPNTLRARLRPVKDGSVEPLLSELEASNNVSSYELDGRKYGAVRNFRIWQRPKKPNSIHPLPKELRTYVGLTGRSSPPVPHQFGTGSENPPQMEEVVREEEPRRVRKEVKGETIKGTYGTDGAAWPNGGAHG
jgi:hypothetical protein